MVAVAWLFVRAARDDAPSPLLVHPAVILLLTVGASGCFGSEPRFLLPAFVLLLPVVVRLSGPSRRWQVVVLVIAATVSWAYGTTWLLGSGPP